MKFHIFIFLCSSCFGLHLNAQSITALHQVKKEHLPKEFLVNTNIQNLQNIDSIKLTYLINNEHLVSKTTNNHYLIKRNTQHFSFHVLTIPPNGEVNIEFKIRIAGNGEFAFQNFLTLFQGTEKTKINLPRLYVSVDNPNLSMSNNYNDQNKETKLQLLPKDTTQKITATPSIKESPTAHLTSKFYTVQLLYLTQFSSEKLTAFCKEFSINSDEVIIKHEKGKTKVFYGKTQNLEEAEQLKNVLLIKHKVLDCFVTTFLP